MKSSTMSPPPGWPGRRRALGAALSAVLAPGLLAGCAGPQLADHAQQRPVLDLRRYFDGPVTAHGMLLDWRGQVTRRFVVRIDGRWQGDEGRLDEHFEFADGERQRRIWTLRREADGRYSGTADDVVGIARGEQAGPAFRWTYTLRIPVDGRDWDIQFDDWMFLIDERTLLNKATMRKFGLPVGEVLLSFSRP